MTEDQFLEIINDLIIQSLQEHRPTGSEKKKNDGFAAAGNVSIISLEIELAPEVTKINSVVCIISIY